MEAIFESGYRVYEWIDPQSRGGRGGGAEKGKREPTRRQVRLGFEGWFGHRWIGLRRRRFLGSEFGWVFLGEGREAAPDYTTTWMADAKA